MTTAEVIATLPDGQRLETGLGPVTVGELRAALATTGTVYITTDEASRRYSRSPRWWCEAAPSIPGAYKDRLWRLPVQGIESHLADITRPRRKRGPWTTAHTVDHRSSHLQAR